MRCKAYILLFLVLFSPQVFAEDSYEVNRQRIIPIDSEIYILVELIKAESWQSLSSLAKPWSEAEVFETLEAVDREALSEAGKNAADRIEQLLSKNEVYSENNIALSAGLNLSVEAYFNSSADENLWTYGNKTYEDRAPVLSIPIEFWFNDGFYAYLEPALRKSRHLITLTDADGSYIPDYTNIPMSFAHVNYHFPDRAFFSAGGDNWTFQVGRDLLTYGSGVSSNLILSSNAEYLDSIRLKGFSEHLTLSWSYINLESWADSTDDDNIQRAYVSHLLEAKPLDFITLYLNESVLFYGEDPEIQFINPLIIYHNLFMKEKANSIMSLGANVAAYKGVTLYAEWTMDQLQTGQEQALYGSGVTATPNADSHLLGIKASLPIGEGFLYGYFEYFYTSPWMYLRNPEELSFYWLHRETSDVLKSRVNIIKPLGFKYGPDTIAFSAATSYKVPGLWEAAVTADYVIKGEHNISTPYSEGSAAAAMKTPTGTAENRLIIGLSGKYDIFSFLSIQIDLAYVDIYNYKHVKDSSAKDFQSAVSVFFDI